MRTPLVVTILLLLCVVGVCAESQGKYKGEKKPTETQQMTGDKQRGTEEMPVVVKIIPPKRDKVESDADAKEKEEKKTLDSRLVFFTECLAAIGFMQLLVFGWQARRLRQTVEATEKLYAAGEKQMQITRDSLEITRKEFNFVHRPKLTIRREQLRVDLDTKGINFVLANTGDLPATNIIGNINVKVIPIQETNDFEKESMPRYGEAAIDISQIVFQRRNSKMLQSGEREFIFFASEEINEATIPSIRRGDYHVLYFYGILNFEGPDGIRRESAFFRKYNSETKTFNPKDDIDYEHC